MVDIYAKLNRYEKTEGKVISLVKEGGGRMDADRDVIYYPEIKYDYDGKEYAFQLRTGSEKPLADKGEKIDLYVNPDNPKDVLINTFMYLWVGPTLLLLTAFIVLVGIAAIRSKQQV